MPRPMQHQMGRLQTFVASTWFLSWCQFVKIKKHQYMDRILIEMTP